MAKPGWQRPRVWNTASGVVTTTLPLVAGAAIFAQSDKEGAEQFLLTAGSAMLVTEVLKQTVRSTRPDGSDDRSFPSAHATLAFSAASFIHQRYGDTYGTWTPALYGVAALAGVARVQADRHRWIDVVAGAAIGYGAARYWTQPLASGSRLSMWPTPGGVAVTWARTF